MNISKTNILNVLRALFALSIAAILLSFPFYKLESFFYDLRFQINPFKFKADSIVTVAVDQKALEHFKGQPDLKNHIAILEQIKKENPKAIYYAMDIKSIAGTKEDKIKFSNSIKNFENTFLFYDGHPNKGEESLLIVGDDYPDLRYTPAALSYDYKNFAEDGVARRAILKANDYIHAQVIIANLVNPITDLNKYRGVFRFYDSYQINVNYQPTGTYKPISFADIIDDRILKNTFSDKIVIIGIDTFYDVSDYFKSVYDNKSYAMSKLEAQANIIATMIHNNGIIKTPSWLNAIITILFSLIVTFAVLKLSPSQGLLVILSTAGSYCLLSWILFSFFGVAIGMAQPLLAVFICYYFFIPYRLIQENKKFWELRQRNVLLTQVEELKNNFLSMMSHDLKTPLARIQGMAEVALQKNNLAPEQKNAVTTIKKSAEELTEFISSILDLSRVESQQIELQLQSKDVNQILSDCIRKVEYLAKEKNIEIVTEFETLFSVKLDPHLLKQVFNNLIENAIKYSPEGSKVLITTEEADGQIIVQVADQGIGISENEVKNIFTKFYRTKNVKNSPIAGSGLGLYLAKYFVELHKGKISVESLPKEGSTFTVQLPMDL